MLVFVAAFYAMRPFIVLVYTAVEHDVEAWACEMGSQGQDSTEEALCRELRAARYLLIPMLVAGVCFLALVAWQRLGVWRRKIVQGNATGGAERADTVLGKV